MILLRFQYAHKMDQKSVSLQMNTQEQIEHTTVREDHFFPLSMGQPKSPRGRV